MNASNEPNVAPPTWDAPKRWLNRTVIGAGLTSTLGDFCYETTTVILPGFLAVLGIPAAVLGVIEGIADAVASFTKMVSGCLADKLGHRKLLVLIDYGLTPMGQILIAIAVGWPLLLLGRLVSWFGKGLRGPFRFVLWLSLIPGALAVLAFLALVKDPEHSPNPALKIFSALRGLPGKFKRYLGAVGLFGIGDFAHSLPILAATQLLAASMGVVHAAQLAGVLNVWRNIVQVAVSDPVGVLGTAVLPVFGFALAATLMVAGTVALVRMRAR